MRLEKTAEIVAGIVHRDHQYAGYPYTVHLSAVVDIVARYDQNPYVLAAAWLHDAPEDTFYSVAHVARDFGTQTSQLVDAVSGFGENRKARVQMVLDKLYLARPEAALIKAADRIANVLFCVRSENASLAKMYLNEAREFGVVVAARVPPGLYMELAEAYRQANELLHSSAAGEQGKQALTPTSLPL